MIGKSYYDAVIETFLIQVRAAMQNSAEAGMAVDHTEEDGVFTNKHCKLCLAVTCVS